MRLPRYKLNHKIIFQSFITLLDCHLQAMSVTGIMRVCLFS